MKRITTWLLLFVWVIAVLSPNVYAAADMSATENIIYFDDGSYIEILLHTADTRAAQSKTGTKTYIFRDSVGEEKWRAELTATFSYTGSTAHCTASNCKVTITDTAWYQISSSASKSANTATGEVVMGYKFLGIKIDEKTVAMNLRCDVNGVLS